MNILLYLNVYKCLMCCAATPIQDSMRVGPSKEYGDTPTITLRFRTLGMTLSRGKSPQAGRNNLLSPLSTPPPPTTNSLKQCSFSFIIDPSARSSPLFLRDHFYQPHDTHSRSLAPSPSAPAYRRPRAVYSFEWQTLPFKFNTLFAPALSSRSRLARPLTCSQIFTPHHHFYLARVDTEPFYRFMACVLYHR